MKKSVFYQEINRNNNAIFSNLRQQPINDNPNIHIDQIWPNDDQMTRGVQIIELNSSDSPLTSPDHEKITRTVIADDKFQRHYEINTSARERRRKKQNENQYDDSDYVQNNVENAFYPGNYEPGNSNLNQDNFIMNHQMNCYSYIDRQYVGSDSSTDLEHAQVQGIQEDNSVEQYDWNVNGDETANYDTDMEGEKRTIWIYSFKNKRLLSESNYELVNIPSRDVTSSSCSIEDTDMPDSEPPRLGSPAFNAYVPRLNLALTATLPTVTEESNKNTSENQTERFIKESSLKPKPLNNWFMSENVTPKTFPPITDRSTSIVNWMALSPRERRQHNVKSSPIPQYTTKLPIVQELIDNVEDKMESLKVSASKPIVNRLSKELIAHKTINTNDGYTIKEKEDTIIKEVIKQSVEIESDMECLPEDRGDYDSHRYIKKPHIRMGRNIVKKSDITDPIEKLNGDNWIIEDPMVVEEDRRTRGMRGDCVSNRLYVKSMCLLKPAEWTEFYPVSGSIPSLQLSIQTDSEIRSASWLKRLMRCFHCFK